MLDPIAYWEKRLTKHKGNRGVGRCGCSKAYNKWLYKRRLKTLEKYLQQTVDDNILDVGAGTGIITDLLLKHSYGVVRALEPTEIGFKQLQEKFKNPKSIVYINLTTIEDYVTTLEKYTSVVAFDVLFHILDDEKFDEALDNIWLATEAGSTIFITDLFSNKRISDSKHCVSRSLLTYLCSFPYSHSKLVPMFVLSQPPAGIPNKVIRYFFLYLWEILLFPVKWELFGHVFGCIYYYLDSLLLKLPIKNYTNKLLIIRKLK